MIAWKFDPPNPKLFRETRRGPGAHQGSATVATCYTTLVSRSRVTNRIDRTFSFQCSIGMCAFGFSKLQFGTMILRSSIKTLLIREGSPLSPSVWPMFVFTEPMIKGSPYNRLSANMLAIAPASRGSPAWVPVPWVSRYDVSLVSSPASLYTRRIRASCASWLGSAMPFVFPS